MSIEGRLNDYSFLKVVAILANSKESGRLQIDYKWGQGLFYFDNGELMSAQVGSLIGFSAVNVALSIEGTCSRFDSHCEPISTQFSETSERLLLNRLLGIQVPASRAANSLGDDNGLTPVKVPAIPSPAAALPVMGVLKTVTPSPPPRTIASPAKPEHPRNHFDLPEHFLATAITQSSIYEERRMLIFRAASIVLLGFVAVAGITVLRSKADTPASRPMSAQTSAKVTPETTSAAFSSRIEDKSGLVSPSTDTSKQPLPPNAPPESRPSDKSAEAGSPQANAPLPAMTRALPVEPAKDEALEEARMTAKRAFKEISVVVKIESGHVVEAYVKNHQPGSESYEYTALRIARRRVYPKDVVGTKTIVCSVASEQRGSKQ